MLRRSIIIVIIVSNSLSYAHVGLLCPIVTDDDKILLLYHHHQQQQQQQQEEEEDGLEGAISIATRCRLLLLNSFFPFFPYLVTF